MKTKNFINGTRLSIGLIIAATNSFAADTESIERGKYLVTAADCTGCHGDPNNTGVLSGGLGIDTPFGTFRTPNITPDKQHGIGNWSVSDFTRAMRYGVGPEGEYLYPVFPYTSFTKLTDQDIADIYAYLMSQPAAAIPNKAHEIFPPLQWRPLLYIWRTLFFTAGPTKLVKERTETWNRGNYLVNAVTHCGECHTPRNVLGALQTDKLLSGNIGGADRQNAPNITPDHETGIGDWSVEDIQYLLKTGMTPESDLVGSAMKAVVRGTSKLTDADRHAMAIYLKSLTPIHVELPPPKIPNLQK